jgi:hypothetical protein
MNEERSLVETEVKELKETIQSLEASVHAL